MNSIKNAIVTITLLAVGYGAYVVLHNPPPQNFEGSSPDSASADIAPQLAASDENVPAVNIELDPGPAAPDAASPPRPASLPGSVGQPQPGGPHDPPERDISRSSPLLTAESSYASVPSDSTGSATSSPSNDDAISYPSTGYEPVHLGMTAAADQPATHAEGYPSPAIDDPNTLQGGPAGQPRDNSPATSPFATESVGPLPAAAGSGPFENAWQTAQQHLQSGNMVDALAVLSDWYGDPTLSTQQHQQIVELLDQIAGTVIYSRQHLLEPEYLVQPGETLSDIAARYRVPEELLAKINGIAPPFPLATGDSLKVVRGPFRAEVSLQRREITVFLGRFYAGRFAVQIGRDLPAEEAFYEVAEKSEGRSYFDRRLGRQVIKGEAENRYGDHWLGMRGDQITAGHSVGIHGRPISASPEAEIGSISLSRGDAEDIHAILSIGSRIHVRR